MTQDAVHHRTTRIPLATALVSVLSLPMSGSSIACADEGRIVELEIKSKYSNIRIAREKNVRTLEFVRESGDYIIESRVNIDKPHELILPYTRYMFTSYLFRPKPEKVLVVGLGGGSMVHFLKHYDPQVKVDVVEIDLDIINIAEKYFAMRAGGNVNIINKDALEYLKTTEARYDVIYMDAFLKPADNTDSSGVPLHLKTIAFYKDIQKKLKPEGLVVFNLHRHDKVKADLKNMRAAFPQIYAFLLPQLNGYIVVGSLAKQRADRKGLRVAADELDGRFKTSYSFRDMADRLAP